MIRYGVEPFLECSTKGDKRFSAFCAGVNGSSIEALYQAAKVFADGRTGLHWRQAKSLQAVNHEELQVLYTKLWDQYMAEHPELMQMLLDVTGVSDIFGQPGHVCQATELWRIRNTYLGL